MPRTRKDSELIAEGIFLEIAKYQVEFSRRIADLEQQVKNFVIGKSQLQEKSGNEKRNLVEKVSNLISEESRKDRGEDKGFVYNDQERRYIIYYLIIEKKLFNDDAEQLYFFIQKQAIPNLDELFLEIAYANNFDLLDRFIKTYVEKVTNTTEEERKKNEERYKSTALFDSQIFKILRSHEKSDEEKYITILASTYEVSYDAKLFIEAEFKDSKKYLEKFLTYLSNEDCETFLRKYKYYYKERFGENLPDDKLPSFNAIKDEIEENKKDKEKRVKQTALFEKTIWDVEVREAIRNPTEEDIVRPISFYEDELLDETPPQTPKETASNIGSAPHSPRRLSRQESKSVLSELAAEHQEERQALDNLETLLRELSGTPKEKVEIKKSDISAFKEGNPKDSKSK